MFAFVLGRQRGCLVGLMAGGTPVGGMDRLAMRSKNQLGCAAVEVATLPA